MTRKAEGRFPLFDKFAVDGQATIRRLIHEETGVLLTLPAMAMWRRYGRVPKRYDEILKRIAAKRGIELTERDFRYIPKPRQRDGARI
jgi:hypothetical protein